MTAVNGRWIPVVLLVQLVTLSFAKLPVARRAVGADCPALRTRASAPRLFGRQGRGECPSGRIV